MKRIIIILIISVLIIISIIYTFRENFESIGVIPFDWKCNPGYSGGEYITTGKTTDTYICDSGCTDDRCRACVNI